MPPAAPRSSPDDFAQAFEAAFARLQVAILTAGDGAVDWPERVSAVVRAGLRFAAADPAGAQTLTSDALARGPDGVARHERVIAYLGACLHDGRAESPDGERLPEVTERAMAGGIVMLAAQRLDLGREQELPGLAPEAIQFVLTPYLGGDEARRIAGRAGPTGPNRG
jgi:AcrR family transcriptional regulator